MVLKRDDLKNNKNYDVSFCKIGKERLFYIDF